jgi:hypothetical protein
MKVSTIAIITLLILALYYYTAERFEIVQTVGQYVAQLVKGMGQDLKEGTTGEAVRNIRHDAENVLEKILEKIKHPFS